MSEVTYDALRKRLAEAEEELSIWRSVFPDIAPERVLPDRRLLLDRIAELEAKLVAAVDIVSKRAAARHKEASLCGSDRSKKHMQIRADEAGQIIALLRAVLAGGEDE